MASSRRPREDESGHRDTETATVNLIYTGVSYCDVGVHRVTVTGSWLIIEVLGPGNLPLKMLLLCSFGYCVTMEYNKCYDNNYYC